MIKNILILGGTGAMGKALVDNLAECGIAVTVTSRQDREAVSNVTYVKGDAHDLDFLKEVIARCPVWDAIVDFMVYSTDEFSLRVEMLLAATKQYIYISSARVYAQSDSPITENTPRLLEVCQDEEYLKTDEYALAKARQENLLLQQKSDNWTIIRPSITYNVNRLQLGVLEKEDWLYRALHGRSIVFSDDIADKLTAMTMGNDVAKGICAVIGQAAALGQVFHITEPCSYKWSDILTVYLGVLKECTGFTPKVITTAKSVCFKLPGRRYQIIYCRYFNRSFDNSKIAEFIDVDHFRDAKSGLEECLKRFLENPQFKDINWALEALHDSAAGERTSLSEIPTLKNKVKYILYRNHMAFVVGILKRIIKRRHG
ncbi:MAG: NAD(P)H-binding protein [Lachnospiraceae bacterium]|nr:NAD(P)H-binding protein [Lachnospiraceae bacterium]